MLDPTLVTIPGRFRNHPLFTTHHCGVNFGFMATRGYYNEESARTQPQVMAENGVTWCTLNANICQESFCSKRVFLDFRYSSGDKELSDMVRRYHDNGIHVLMKPCLTPLDGAWMGAVTFPVGHQIPGVFIDYWKEWFASFTDALKYYADFAQENQVEGMLVGAEYYGTEYRSEEWRRTIAAVREIYSGPLSYEFIADSLQYPLDWFNDLDFLSYSYYPPAQPATKDFANAPVLTVDDMMAFLSPNVTAIQDICKRFGNKPIAFTELGVRSAHGCTAQPSDFLTETYYDGEEQANYMEAVFRTYSAIPQWLGLYWWIWGCQTEARPVYGDNGEKSFTLAGKPALGVLRHWYQDVFTHGAK